MAGTNLRTRDGDVLEVENIDSTTIFGKTALRNLLIE